MLCFNEGFLVVRFPFMLDFLFFCLLMEVSYSCRFPLMFCNLHWRFGLKKKKKKFRHSREVQAPEPR